MASGAVAGEIVGARFEQLYSEWSTYVRNMRSYSSSDDDFVQNRYFDAIVALGSDALPFIMAKLKSDEYAHFLIHALTRITGKHFSLEELDAYRTLADGPSGNQAMVEVWLSWWVAQQ